MRRRHLLCAALALALACAEDAGAPLGADLAWTAEVVDFGAVLVDTVEDRGLRLSNETTEEVVARLAIEGPGFELETGEVYVAPGETASVVVRFSPGAEGPVEGALTARWGQDGARTVRLVGAGVTSHVRVAPGVLNFAGVVLGRTRTAAVMVENRGAIRAAIEPARSEGLPRCRDSRRTPFCWAGQGIRLEPGEAAPLPIRYTPTGPERHFGVLSLECSACDLREVELRGLGLDRSLACDAQVDAGARTVRVGAEIEATARCENLGHEPLEIVSVEWEGDGAFSSGVAAPSIPPRGEVEIPIRFAPTDFGAVSATLIVTAGPPVPGETAEIAVVGVGGGPALNIWPGTTLEVGQVPAGVGGRLRLDLENIGDAPLTVDAADVAGQRTPLGLVLPPNTVAPIDVDYVAPEAGPFELPLTFTTNDAFAPTARVLGTAVRVAPCRPSAPQLVDLGVTAPYRPTVGQVVLQNPGRSECVLYGARLGIDAAADVRLPIEAGPTTIAPGGEAAVFVEASPRAGTSTATVQLLTSGGVLDVPIRATADEDALLVSPAHVDFGVAPTTCTRRTETIRVYRSTPSPADLIDVRVDGAAFSLEAGPDLSAGPVPLAQGDVVPLTVRHAPTAADRTNAGTLALTSREAGGGLRLQRVPLLGRGAAAPVVTERFVQLDRAALDLLFVVDFSGCTGQEQSALARDYSDLVRIVHAAALDAQIGVTSTGVAQEDGRLLHPDRVRGSGFGGPEANRLIRVGQPDDAELFGRAVQAINLYGGSARDESARGAAYRALSPDRLDGHNRGLLRPHAHLTIVALQDEPDQSGDYEEPRFPGRSVDVFRDAFWALKGYRGREAVSFLAIAGDVPGGCTGVGGTAGPAPEMARLAQETHGFFQSVCRMSPRDLAPMAGPIAGQRTDFWLRQPPVPSTLVVRIDGAPVPPSGWTYDSADRSVGLTGPFVPEPGSVLEIDYAPACP